MIVYKLVLYFIIAVHTGFYMLNFDKEGIIDLLPV